MYLLGLRALQLNNVHNLIIGSWRLIPWYKGLAVLTSIYAARPNTTVFRFLENVSIILTIQSIHY